MARSLLAKVEHLSDEVLAAAARARARALALVHGAMAEERVDQVELARRLGVKKSAVNAFLHGNGNVRLNTLAEYLGVLGYEVDLVAVNVGELAAARDERRGPRHVCLTISDQDRESSTDTEAIDLAAWVGRRNHIHNGDLSLTPRSRTEVTEAKRYVADAYKRVHAGTRR